MKKFISSALIALAAVAFVGCNKSNPGDVALAATQATMDGGDLAQYVEPSATNKAAINEMNKQNAEMLKAMNATYKDLKVVSVKEDGDKATVEVSVTITMNGEDKTQTTPMKLKKVDGKWYLDASEFAAKGAQEAQPQGVEEATEEATEEGAEEATEEGAEEAPEAEEVQE